MYRTTDTAYYDHPKIRSLPFAAKALGQYFFTNRHTHISGIYFFKKSYALEELGLKSQEFDKYFQILLKSGFCRWDEERQIIWVVSMLKRQPGGRNPKIVKGIGTYLASLYNSPLIPLFLKKYQSYGIAYQYPMDSLSIPPIGTEQEQDQEQKQENPPTPLTGGVRNRQSVEDSRRIAEEAMDRIDLEPFRQKYDWLDWEDEFPAFKDHHLARPGNYHGAKRITDWSRALHNWARAEWKKPKTETNYREEFLRGAEAQ